MNEVTEKIDKLRAKRGWNVYKLAEESDISDQTIYNWVASDTYPLIPALKKICLGLGITMAEFFAEGELVELNDERKELLDDYISLTRVERDAVKTVIKSYKENKK